MRSFINSSLFSRGNKLCLWWGIPKKMKGKFAAIFALVLITMLATVSAIPVSIDRVEFDDVQITEDQTNRLDVERGKAYDVEIFLNSSQNVDDVEVEAFISGFEHNNRLRLADRTGPFDMDANITYRKVLRVSISDLADEDDYKLRIIVADRDGNEVIANFPLKIDVERHDLKIVDAIFTPNNVMAGRALLSVIRIENFGEKDENDVKVTVRLPELGIGASDYIEEIEFDEEEETEELFIKIPKCAKPGVYDAQIIVQYNNGFSRVTSTEQINVLKNPACNKEQEQVEVVMQEKTERNQSETVEAVPRKSSIRTALEIVLLVLVALLIIIGLIIGLSRLRE